MSHEVFVRVERNTISTLVEVRVDCRKLIEFGCFNSAIEWAHGWCDSHPELNPFLSIDRRGE